jgi:hypothetical protein
MNMGFETHLRTRWEQLVKDEDTKAQTGGTGLGKMTDGTTMFGVGGHLPAKVLDMMQATTARQLEIRRSAQEIVPKLKSHNLPTTELEQSVAAMKAVEEALAKRDGVEIRSAYASAVDSLSRSRSAIGKHVVVQRTQDAALARRLEDMQSQGSAHPFKGYEQIIAHFGPPGRFRQRKERPESRRWVCPPDASAEMVGRAHPTGPLWLCLPQCAAPPRPTPKSRAVLKSRWRRTRTAAGSPSASGGWSGFTASTARPTELSP